MLFKPKQTCRFSHGHALKTFPEKALLIQQSSWSIHVSPCLKYHKIIVLPGLYLPIYPFHDQHKLAGTLCQQSSKWVFFSKLKRWMGTTFHMLYPRSPSPSPRYSGLLRPLPPWPLHCYRKTYLPFISFCYQRDLESETQRSLYTAVQWYIFFVFLKHYYINWSPKSNSQKERAFPTLTVKAPITTAADDIHKYFFIVFSEKIRLDVSSESSGRGFT